MDTVLRLTSSITATPTRYNDEAAAQRAAIPLAREILLDNDLANASVITIRPTAPISGGFGILEFYTHLGNNDSVPVDLTHQRINGSGYLSLAGLQALQIKLSADPLTPAEIQSEDPASRTAYILCALSSGEGSDVYFSQATLTTSTAGQMEFLNYFTPDDLPSSTYLTITVADLPLASQIEILTICNDPD